MITRFAPSPTGKLHPGHAYSALAAWQFARQHHARFLLRIEDIDTQRCRPEFSELIETDLRWLGLDWERPVLRQSEHVHEYQRVAHQLQERGLLYPCFCSRRDIQTELEASGHTPQENRPAVYPGICRGLSESEQQDRIAAGEEYSLRLNLEQALRQLPSQLSWNDRIHGKQLIQPQLLGDVILVRRDIGCSYHLCVTVDDARQQITHIVRGQDLFESTHVHRILQALLAFPVPEYLHHPLITDERGERLAKRLGSESLQSIRERGISAAEFLHGAGFTFPDF